MPELYNLDTSFQQSFGHRYRRKLAPPERFGIDDRVESRESKAHLLFKYRSKCAAVLVNASISVSSLT